MKTKYLLLLVTSFFLISYQAPQAFAVTPDCDPGCWIDYLITKSRAKGTTTIAPDGRPRLSRQELNEMRQAERAGRNVVVGEDRNCKENGLGCVDCKPAEVPKITKVQTTNGVVEVRIEKAGQNYLHPSIMEVLKKMATEEGRNVVVTSGFRSCQYQKDTKQGVSKSMHLKGRAADFHIEGKSYSSSYLFNLGRKVLNYYNLDGGTGIYCGAYSHVDTGNTRDWNYCK